MQSVTTGVFHRHKVFEGLPARGKTSIGLFYGLKLPFVINHKGQIVALKITPGNTADAIVLDEMTRHLAGKLYADNGYISHELFQTLWQRGLHLITGIRRNMKNFLMPMADKIMLRKRFLIETVLDTLKSEMGLEHSRHRSPVNAMVHVLFCLVAYAFRPGKTSISLPNQRIKAYPYVGLIIFDHSTRRCDIGLDKVLRSFGQSMFNPDKDEPAMNAFHAGAFPELIVEPIRLA